MPQDFDNAEGNNGENSSEGCSGGTSAGSGSGSAGGSGGGSGGGGADNSASCGTGVSDSGRANNSSNTGGNRQDNNSGCDIGNNGSYIGRNIGNADRHNVPHAHGVSAPSIDMNSMYSLPVASSEPQVGKTMPRSYTAPRMEPFSRHQPAFFNESTPVYMDTDRWDPNASSCKQPAYFFSSVGSYQPRM